MKVALPVVEAYSPRIQRVWQWTMTEQMVGKAERRRSIIWGRSPCIREKEGMKKCLKLHEFCQYHFYQYFFDAKVQNKLKTTQVQTRFQLTSNLWMASLTNTSTSVAASSLLSDRKSIRIGITFAATSGNFMLIVCSVRTSSCRYLGLKKWLFSSNYTEVKILFTKTWLQH